MKTSQIIRRSTSLVVAALLCLCVADPFSTARAGKPGHAAAAVWASDALYDVILTDTSFKSPPARSTDILFNFAGGGLEGQRSVAEAAPGDPDYNGGRWNVMLVSFTDRGKLVHDPDGDGAVNFELTNAEDVLYHAELAHLVIVPANFYFECPLLPRKNGR